MEKLSPKAQGNLGEAAALKELLKHDLIVCPPYGDNAPYDYIVDNKHGSLFKVQVKSSSQYENGAIEFKTGRDRLNTKGNYHVNYQQNDVDVFILYNVILDELYLISFTEAGSCGTSIRVDPPKRTGGSIKSKMRQDYLFEKRYKEVFKL